MLEISNRVEIANTLKHEMSANAAQYEGIITPRRCKSRLSSRTRSCQDPVALRTTRSLVPRAIKAEGSGQSAYEAFVKDAKASIEAKSKDIANKSEFKAKTEDYLVQLS